MIFVFFFVNKSFKLLSWLHPCLHLGPAPSFPLTPWHSQRLLNTLLKQLWQQLQPQVFFNMMLQAWHLFLGSFPTFFFAETLRLHQVGWEASVYSHFQISPEMLNRVQIWALAGLLEDIHRVVLKPLLCYLGCVLWVVVLLEDEPSPRALWSRLSSRMSLYFLHSYFPSTLTSLPVPAAEKHPHSIMLSPPCFTVGMVLGRWWPVPGFLQT